MSIFNAAVPADGVPAPKASFRTNWAAGNAKLAERVSIKDFGAVCNGTTDDTAAWVAAIAYLKSKGLANDARDRPILWVPPYSKFDPSAITWDWPMTVVLEGNTYVTKPWVIVGNFTLIGMGCEGGSIQQSRGAISLIYPSGAGPWTPGCTVQLRYVYTVNFEGIGIIGPPGSAALLIGEGVGTTPILNCAQKFFKNCAFSANNSAGSSSVTIENAFWCYFNDCSFTCAGTNAYATLWITDSRGNVAFVNNTGLLQLQNCNINVRGIHFGLSTGTGSPGGGSFWFDEVLFENPYEAFITFDYAAQDRRDFRLGRLNFADSAGTPPFYVVDNTVGASIEGIELMDHHVGLVEVQLWKGRLPVDGLKVGRLWKQYDYANVVYDVMGQLPILHSVHSGGRVQQIDAFAGRDWAPQMVPANAISLIKTPPNTLAYFDTSFGVTVTGGQTAPDGSATAISFANTQGSLGACGKWDNGFASITDHWVIVGAWLRAGTQSNPIHQNPGSYLINIAAQDGSGVTVDGVSTVNVETLVDWAAQNKNMGWHLVWAVGRVQASVGITIWQTGVRLPASSTTLVWNLFAFALPASAYTRRDIAGILSKGAVFNCGAKPGVLAQSPHQTLLTGAGATASRPAAATVGAGAQWFDTTLGIPIWSTGSVWKNAAGTTV